MSTDPTSIGFTALSPLEWVSLVWFVHPIVFMLCSAWVVAVLYRREFRSRTLKALLAGLR